MLNNSQKYGMLIICQTVKRCDSETVCVNNILKYRLFKRYIDATDLCRSIGHLGIYGNDMYHKTIFKLISIFKSISFASLCLSNHHSHFITISNMNHFYDIFHPKLEKLALSNTLLRFHVDVNLKQIKHLPNLKEIELPNCIQNSRQHTITCLSKLYQYGLTLNTQRIGLHMQASDVIRTRAHNNVMAPILTHVNNNKYHILKRLRIIINDDNNMLEAFGTILRDLHNVYDLLMSTKNHLAQIKICFHDHFFENLKDTKQQIESMPVLRHQMYSYSSTHQIPANQTNVIYWSHRLKTWKGLGQMYQDIVRWFQLIMASKAFESWDTNINKVVLKIKFCKNKIKN